MIIHCTRKELVGIFIIKGVGEQIHSRSIVEIFIPMTHAVGNQIFLNCQERKI